MKSTDNFEIDYIEIYSYMAKSLAYWHVKALGFKLIAVKNSETDIFGISSYVLKSNYVQLVITSTFPPYSSSNNEISSFLTTNYCGVKRIALKVSSVPDVFAECVSNGAVPITFPYSKNDENGTVEEASVKLYDNSEITFTNRNLYKGLFKPGYKEYKSEMQPSKSHITAYDHIASEVRINESQFWTDYLHKVLNVKLVQSIQKSAENKTGMTLKINQSDNKTLTFVIAEPDGYTEFSKVQKNIDLFGPGIHHLAFAINDLVETAQEYLENGVEFVSFPKAYYDILRSNPEYESMDIDLLQKMNILCDKEGDSFLLQKFIKPISDRPFFLYELVQRIDGYDGFALKNINVLKKAEELEIMNKI